MLNETSSNNGNKLNAEPVYSKVAIFLILKEGLKTYHQNIYKNS